MKNFDAIIIVEQRSGQELVKLKNQIPEDQGKVYESAHPH